MGEQVVGEQHRLRVLQVREPGHAMSTVPLGLLDERGCSSSTERRRSRAWSRRNSRRSVATWSLRLRPARSLPPSGAEPLEQTALEGGVHVLVVDAVGAEVPRRTSASSSSSAASMRRELVVVEEPGAMQDARVRARAGRS